MKFEMAKLRLDRIRAHRGDQVTWAALAARRAEQFVEGLLLAVASIEKIHAVNNDKELSKAGRERRVAELRDKAVDDAKMGANALREHVLQARDWVNKLPAAPALERADVTGFAMDSELRTVLRSLSPSERSEALNQCIGGKSPQLLTAIVRAPAFLSGLEDKQYETLRRAAVATHQRQALELVADASYSLKVAGAWLTTTMQALEGVVPPSTVKRPRLQTQDVSDLDQLLVGLRTRPEDPIEWLREQGEAQRANQALEAAQRDQVERFNALTAEQRAKLLRDDPEQHQRMLELSGQVGTRDREKREADEKRAAEEAALADNVMRFNAMNEGERTQLFRSDPEKYRRVSKAAKAEPGPGGAKKFSAMTEAERTALYRADPGEYERLRDAEAA